MLIATTAENTSTKTYFLLSVEEDQQKKGHFFLLTSPFLLSFPLFYVATV